MVSVGGVVWWAFKQSAPPQFPSASGRWALCLVALLVYAVATLARGWRWHVILRHGHIEHEAKDAYGLTVVGYMGNTVLPARGGEALRIILLSQRSTARRREILGAILPERLLDAAALATLFCILTFAGTGGSPTGKTPAIFAAAALAGGLAALIIYLRLRIAGRFAHFAARIRPVARASRLLLTAWGASLFALSVGVWLLEALVFWLTAESINVGLSLLEALLVVVLGSFLALVPAGPGYAGTYDAAMLFALRAVDVAESAALGCVILFRFVVFLPITLLGLVLMVTRYGGLRAILRSR